MTRSKKEMPVKKILMFLNDPYPGDIRVFKESDALMKAGFEVHLLCLRKNATQPLEERLENGFFIHRVTTDSSTFQKGIWDIVIATFWKHPLFYRRARKLCGQHAFEAVHVHDLPLAYTAFSLAEEFGAAKVLDLHENYPEALAVWFQWRKNPFIRLKNNIFFNYKKWSGYEINAIKRADHVITVVEEMRDRMIEVSGERDEKFSVVSNTEQSGFIQQVNDPEVYEDWKKEFIITYTGNVGPHRGVDTVVKGMQYLKDIKDCKLVVAGSMNDAVRNYLIGLCTELGIEKNVRLLGYQPFSKFFSFMKNASINVIPHNSNPHTDHTIPHKLFQCMMVGRPVIVSSCKPLKRVVESVEAGKVFQAGNAEGFASKVRELYNNRILTEKLAKNGLGATLEGKYNWDTDARTLVNYYQSIA